MNVQIKVDVIGVRTIIRRFEQLFDGSPTSLSICQRQYVCAALRSAYVASTSSKNDAQITRHNCVDVNDHVNCILPTTDENEKCKMLEIARGLPYM